MVEIIAHRGARSLAPENTLAAARLAHQIGAHRWETDANLTLDGHLVLFHDATLTRCTNAPKIFGYDPDQPGPKTGSGRPGKTMDHLDNYLLLELGMLEAGSFFQRTDPFGTLDQIGPEDLIRFNQELIPSLYDGLVLTRDLNWCINIELKDYHNEPELYFIASRTLGDLARSGISRDRITISSFNHQWLRWVREHAPDLEIQALVGPQADIPLNFDDPVFTNDEFMVLNINAKLISPGQIRTLKARGKRVNLFTVNDPHDYMRFVAAGVDGIFTDFPQRFVK